MILLIEVAELRVIVDEVDSVVIAGIDGAVIEEEVLIEYTVLVRETVQPPRFRQAFTHRRFTHVVADAGAVRLVDGALGLPFKGGLRTGRVDADELGDSVELGPVSRLVLSEVKLLPVVAVSVDELEDVAPACRAILEEDVMPVKEIVQPRRFRQTLTHRMSVQVVVEANSDKLVLAEINTLIAGGLVVAGLADIVLNVDEVLGKDRVHLVPRPKQTLAHRKSVYVVVNILVEIEVKALVNLVTDGELAVDKVPDEDSNDELVTSGVPGPETLPVKDTVHAAPRFTQAFTHKRFVQVAVVTGLVVAGSDVARLVLGETGDPNNEVLVGRSPDALGVNRVEVVVEDVCDGEIKVDGNDVRLEDAGDISAEFDVTLLIGEDDAVGMNEEEVWIAEIEVLDAVEDVTVELLRLGFGTQVGPRHRLAQIKPEQEGVGDEGAFVVLNDVMVGDVLEGVDTTVDETAFDSDAVELCNVAEIKSEEGIEEI